ncbi:MAG: ketol-acid reductoisomerase [Thaumarchaeota archaeon]|nr:ketol-acid reductoisomerase [Nitrososphaerota archaeon]|tara:strand:- start:4578 stop:5579 length:1002 start_codon:yes stop_codon:yes gene_type:complete
MAQVWHDDDVDMSQLKNETISVIGYGIQGAAQASNLKDSGLNVIVGLRKGGSSWQQAVDDGHKVMEVSKAAEESDIIHILVPDMQQPKVYEEQIAPHLKEGNALGFSHGLVINYQWVKPPEWVDVLMVAPKAPGRRVRELYLDNFGTPALVAVEQDFTNNALNRALAIAKGLGCARAGLLQTTFKEEVETDLFGEQADLCGGAASLIQNAFETLVNRGYQPEIAYFECLHELKLIVDLVQQYGLKGMYQRVSETARYGGLTRGDRVINKSSRDEMEKILDEIQSGQFAEEWRNIYNKEGKQSFDKYLDKIASHQIESTGKALRDMMWPNETNE